MGPNAFYQPQYGALSAWGSIGNSNYHALTASYKIRTNTLTADFNYTFSHSLDDSSGLQTGGGYNGESFILNPFRQRDMYSNSDFDARHQINANTVWQLPFGHRKSLLANAGKVANGIIGGWQLTGIFRFNTGMPVGFYNGTTGVFDDARWATNWEVQSNAVRTAIFNTCPTRIRWVRRSYLAAIRFTRSSTFAMPILEKPVNATSSACLATSFWTWGSERHSTLVGSQRGFRKVTNCSSAGKYLM